MANLHLCILSRVVAILLRCYHPLTDTIVSSQDDDAFDDIEDNLPRALTAAVNECFEDARTKGHPDQADILILRQQKLKSVSHKKC